MILSTAVEAAILKKVIYLIFDYNTFFFKKQGLSKIFLHFLI